MNWIIKAKVQKLLSSLPKGKRINYFIQRHIAQSLPVNDREFLTRVHSAIRNFDVYKKYTINVDYEKDVFFEFGAGWDLTIPLVYFMLGINAQILIDINPNVKFDLVNDTLWRLVRFKDDIEKKYNIKLRNTSTSLVSNIRDLDKIFGIRYIAPLDAAHTGLPESSINFISNTATFEHIPSNDIIPILKESYRLLKPGSVMSCLIDLKDHYSYVDRSITYYNFLTFNDQRFSKYNSVIHYQNRLRYPDYITMIKSSKFSIIEERVQYPSKEDIGLLKKMKIHDKFRNYGLNDLGVKTVHEILGK
jgi:hypothetical protein